MKNAIKNINVRKFRMTLIKLMMAACTVVMMLGTSLTAFAGNSENTGGKDTTTGTTLISLAFWVVRIAILIIGGAPSLIKIVQGSTDENPRDRNAGIASLVIVAACFAGTFIVEGLI